jgi:hypothetical protein
MSARLGLDVRLVSMAAWTVTMAAIAAVGAFAGSFSTGTSVLLLAAAVLPPVVLLMVFRGAPPKSVSQVLYDEEQAPSRVPGLRRSGRDL